MNARTPWFGIVALSLVVSAIAGATTTQLFTDAKVLRFYSQASPPRTVSSQANLVYKQDAGALMVDFPNDDAGFVSISTGSTSTGIGTTTLYSFNAPSGGAVTTHIPLPLTDVRRAFFVTIKAIGADDFNGGLVDYSSRLIAGQIGYEQTTGATLWQSGDSTIVQTARGGTITIAGDGAGTNTFSINVTSATSNSWNWQLAVTFDASVVVP